jgi:hypothetical protein
MRDFFCSPDLMFQRQINHLKRFTLNQYKLLIINKIYKFVNLIFVSYICHPKLLKFIQIL